MNLLSINWKEQSSFDPRPLAFGPHTHTHTPDKAGHDAGVNERQVRWETVRQLSDASTLRRLTLHCDHLLHPENTRSQDGQS